MLWLDEEVLNKVIGHWPIVNVVLVVVDHLVRAILRGIHWALLSGALHLLLRSNHMLSEREARSLTLSYGWGLLHLDELTVVELLQTQ